MQFFNGNKWLWVLSPESLHAVYLCYSQNTAEESLVLPWFSRAGEIFETHNRFSELQTLLQPESSDSYDMLFLFHLKYLDRILPVFQ